jgi:DNA-3-methyladenine glycosylase
MPRHAPDRLIPQSFFLRPVAEVARDLLGRHLVAGEVRLRITEVEAYGGLEDSASHCRHGRTPRNAPMWGPGGHAYVYFCYGVHWMLNVVTGPEGAGAAVLIRGCQVVAGLDRVCERRGRRPGSDLLSGPGKVAQALAVTGAFNGEPLFAGGGLELRSGTPGTAVQSSPRIGIAFARPEDRDARLRFLAVT